MDGRNYDAEILEKLDHLDGKLDRILEMYERSINHHDAVMLAKVNRWLEERDEEFRQKLSEMLSGEEGDDWWKTGGQPPW